MDFDEYRNHAVATLHREAGEPFFCYYDPKGLPYKIVYYPHGNTAFAGKQDEPSDLGLNMQLISARGSNALDTYLSETLGLTPNVDYQRHNNGERGGSFYFDILTKHAIDVLVNRAKEIGQASASDRAARRTNEVPTEGRH